MAEENDFRMKKTRERALGIILKKTEARESYCSAFDSVRESRSGLRAGAVSTSIDVQATDAFPTSTAQQRAAAYNANHWARSWKPLEQGMESPVVVVLPF